MTLEFYPETHTYKHAGRVVPSVTDCLGFSAAGIPAPVLEFARARGKAVHLACEYYDEDDLDESRLDPAIKNYVIAWKKFRADTSFEVTESEKRIYSERHGYAGTLDRIGIINGRDATVVDIKAVNALSPETALQTAAYEDAYRTDRRTKPLRRFAVQLRPDGTYRVKEYTSKADMSVFLSFLQIHQWRKINGKQY